MKITVERYHDISCGHRVVGHESKCRNLHGHNYRITFICEAATLDDMGRVVDFGVIKSTLCQWLEDVWDHKFLIWEKDPWVNACLELDAESFVLVPFNPTAENMAMFLLAQIGPYLLSGKGVELVRVVVEETRKCSAVAEQTPMQARFLGEVK